MIFPQQIGPYRVLRPLGGGGFSEVFLGEDTRTHQLGKFVALKRVRPELRGKGLFYAKSIVSEGKIAKSLTTPHMIKVDGVMAHEGEPVMVMEYVLGFGLDDLLNRVAGRGIPWPWVGIIGLQIVEALRDLHGDGPRKGYVHQDLKPSNIRVTPNGLVKVLDLGIAAPLLKPLSRIRQGTPGYRSPEQVLGATRLGAASDVYTLGIVLFELTTGKRLFPESVCRDVDKIGQAQRRVSSRLQRAVDEGILPEKLGAILAKLLCYSIRERTESASAVNDLIQPWVKEQHVEKQAFRAWSRAIYQGFEAEREKEKNVELPDVSLSLGPVAEDEKQANQEVLPSWEPATSKSMGAAEEALDGTSAGLGFLNRRAKACVALWRRPGPKAELARFFLLFTVLMVGFWFGFELVTRTG